MGYIYIFTLVFKLDHVSFVPQYLLSNSCLENVIVVGGWVVIYTIKLSGIVWNVSE